MAKQQSERDLAKNGISIQDGAVGRDLAREDDVIGTGVAGGRNTLIELGEVDPELQRSVDAYNALVRDAYRDFLENFGVLHTVMPVARVQLIHVSQVQANDYNPNSVAGQEMRLLHTSISSDGYTQPIVSIWDPEAAKPACTCGVVGDAQHEATCDVVTKPAGRYIIVDGFHRYTTMRRFQDIADSTNGYLPVVVLDKSPADRIASTVRHNRARGKHSVAGMGNLVFQMLEAGEDEATICKKLGLDAEELLRLKHVTGYSKLYADRAGFSTSVLTGSQVKSKAEYKKENPDEHILPY